MIRELRVNNLAVVESTAADFGAGLNVVSGETGAGKSVVLGALRLALGARATTAVVRTGTEAAMVELVLELSPQQCKATGQPTRIHIKRRIPARGSGRSTLNGDPITLPALQQLGGQLVQVAGQHDQRLLLDTDTHRGLLDDFGRHTAPLRAMERAWEELSQAEARLARLQKGADMQSEREAALDFQLKELSAHGPVLGEYEELVAERNRLRTLSDRKAHARTAERALYSGDQAALEQLALAAAALEELHQMDPAWAEPITMLRELSFGVEELVRELQAVRSSAADPERLQQIEDRLQATKRLMRRHACTADELVDRHARLERERLELDDLEGHLERAERQRVQAREHTRAAADALTQARTKSARRLEKVLVKQLSELAMPAARLRVMVNPVSAGLALDATRFVTRLGADLVELHLSANAGEEPRPLSEVASGGELSRVLLAMAVVGRGHTPTLVFDEIDAGMSGETAEVVGRKLRELAAGNQVIAISHLPQVAGLADTHMVVDKCVRGGRTRSAVRQLDTEGRVRELARMIGGRSAADRSQAYARELMKAWRAA